MFWDVTDHGKSQQINIANKWKSAFKRLNTLQQGILKWGTKAKRIFLSALYIMLCCLKEVKISEVNLKAIGFFLLHSPLQFNRGGKIFFKEQVTNIECSSSLFFCFMVHFHQNVKAGTVLRSCRLPFFKRNYEVHQMIQHSFPHWFSPHLIQV